MSPPSSLLSKAPLVTVRIQRTGPFCPIGFDAVAASVADAVTTSDTTITSATTTGTDTIITTTSTSTNTTTNTTTTTNPSNEISFSIVPGGCIWLDGPSGRGKTTIAMSLVPELYHQQQRVLSKLQLQVQCDWYPRSRTTATTTTPSSSSSLLVSLTSSTTTHHHHHHYHPERPSVGILFQQTTLIDELTVAGNLALAIHQCNNHHHQNDHHNHTKTSLQQQQQQQQQQQMKAVMEMVGLNYLTDGNKRCYELSGGMARRVSLAIQLLQQRHIIVLDEPFTGLDRPTAISIAKELVRLRHQPHPIALVLITHEPELAHIVLYGESTMSSSSTNQKLMGNVIVPLPEPKHQIAKYTEGASFQSSSSSSSATQPSHYPPIFPTTGIYMYERFVHRLYDYIVYSIPLIVCTFIATGLAISMISADALQRLPIQEPIEQLIDTEVKPLIRMITGEPNINPLYMIGIKMKVKQLLQTTIPNAKMKVYTIGLIQLFTLEIGPLLTGLLLAGRIGGSYAGNIVTMMTTSQIHLLRTMGISTNVWLFYPTLYAAWMAGPILTFLGTSIALFLIGTIGVQYQIISSMSEFWIQQVHTTLLPTLRLQGIVMSQPPQQGVDPEPPFTTTNSTSIFELDYYRTTYNPNSWYDTLIEIITYPILFAMIKSVAFITIIICTAEVCTRYYNNYNYYYHHHEDYRSASNRHHKTSYRHHHALTHRDVPHVITTSIVVASLGIILADWGFSRLWLQRH
jgi:ABC-type nitrate/sulfonate/bicarbonate transport system ATPase subunit